MQVSFGGEIRLGEFSLIGYFFFATDDVSTRVKLNASLQFLGYL